MSSLEIGKLELGTIKTRFLENGSPYEGWNYGKCNSAGGIGVKHKLYNASEKSMKYITFVYIPYNQVGDAVASTTSGEIEASGKLTGPFNPNQVHEARWGILWYNPTIVRVELKAVFIQYMDGSEETITGKDIVRMDSKNSIYYEKIESFRIKERKLSDASRKLSANYDKDEAIKVFSTVLLEFKDDEETLLKVIDEADPFLDLGFYLGDAIEKEYSSNEKLMEKAILFWKQCIERHLKDKQTYGKVWYLSRYNEEERGYPTRYAAKIRKYEPEYVIPGETETGFGGLINKLLEKIISIISKK